MLYLSYPLIFISICALQIEGFYDIHVFFFCFIFSSFFFIGNEDVAKSLENNNGTFKEPGYAVILKSVLHKTPHTEIQTNQAFGAQFKF